MRDLIITTASVRTSLEEQPLAAAHFCVRCDVRDIILTDIKNNREIIMAMHVILGAIKEFNDDALMMARQLGSEGFHFNTPPIAANDEKYWTVRALKWLREYTENLI